MTAAQNLAIFILSTQAASSLFLLIGYLLDRETFKKAEVEKRALIPDLLKSVKLLRFAEVPIMMSVYFLSLVFVIFSYVGVILMIIQLLRIMIG